MKLSDVYLSGYCDGDGLSNQEVLEAMQAFKQAADSVIILGPAFRVTFKELNNCYLWLDSVAIARELI